MPLPMGAGMGAGLPQMQGPQGPPPQRQQPNPMELLMIINQKLDKLAQLIMTIAKPGGGGPPMPPQMPPGQMR